MLNTPNYANILAMYNSSLLNTLSPKDVRLDVRNRVRQRRKEQKLTQAALAEKADVSLGSLKRFESTGHISLVSLIKIAFALGYEEDFALLFSERSYQSIEEVIADAARE